MILSVYSVLERIPLRVAMTLKIATPRRISAKSSLRRTVAVPVRLE